MRRVNSKRLSRRKNQAKKSSLELKAKVEVLLETLTRERLEGKVDETKQEIEENGKNFLELATTIRLSAEKHELNHYVIKVDELVRNVEAKGELLIGRIDSLKSLAAIEAIDNIENNLDALYQETMELFRVTLIDLKSLAEKTYWQLMKQREGDLHAFRKAFPDKASQLALLARVVKADKKIAKEIDELSDYIADVEINLVIESDELNKLLPMQDISEEDKFNEFTRVFDKELDYCQKVVEELGRLASALNPYIQRKQQRQRLLNVFTTIFMLLTNFGLYVSSSYQQHMILPGWSETTTWIICGIILTIISAASIWFMSIHLAMRLILLKNIHIILTYILLYVLIIICSAISQFDLFIIVYHFLYITIYYCISFLSFPNPTISLIVNGIPICAILPICIRIALKYFKKVFLWMPEK